MFSESRLYRPAARTAPLTDVMRAALTTIRANRVAYAYNGISRPTVEALAAAGEIVLEFTHTWGTTEARKPFNQGDWAAYPAPLASSASDAIRIVRWGDRVSLHLGCDCEPAEGHELHRAYRAEKLAEAVAEAQSLATVYYPVRVCAKAPTGHTPAPGEQRSAAAIAAEQSRTPSEALARTLRRLGLAQGRGKDFRVEGFYRNGERQYTYALVLSNRATELITEHADRIEGETAATPFPFRVSIRYAGRHPFIDVSNGGPGERVRESAPVATPAPAPAVEDVLAGTAAAALALHTAGAAPAAEESVEHPAEPVRTDCTGAPLEMNAPVLLHSAAGHPSRGIVCGWAPTGELLASLPNGMVARIAAPARVELITTPALTAEELRELLAEARAEEEPATTETATPPPATLGGDLVEILLAAIPEDVLDGTAQYESVTDTEALDAGFRAVAGWSKHIAGGRAAAHVCAHVNTLTGRAFAELLGRMADAGVTSNSLAGDFFAALGRELVTTRP